MKYSDVERGDDGAAHALDDLAVGLAPGGAQRVDVAAPAAGVGQGPAVAVDGDALEVAAGLDEPGLRRRRQPEGGCGRGSGLSRALQGRGDDLGDVVPGGGQDVGDLLGHLVAQGRQVVAGQAAVEDAPGVVHLVVLHEVDRRARHAVILARSPTTVSHRVP